MPEPERAGPEYAVRFGFDIIVIRLCRGLSELAGIFNRSKGILEWVC